MKCAELGEFGLIARLARKLRPPRGSGVVVGIGDDAAVLRSRDPNRYLLFKTDPVVEGIHFVLKPSRASRAPRATPYQVGWKALARNLSDIAAMGGVPRWAVVSLGLTTETRVATVDGIYRGMQAVANRFGVAIVGGDVTRTDGPLFVSVSLVGEVEKQRLKLRSAARAGEMVFITGTLGGSRLGKHLRFTPRIDEARWLARHFPVGAMMDVSDGLGSDLRRLAEASGMGFDVLADAIPVSGAARRLAKADGTTGLEHAWCDGEDFELLFTLPATRADDLLRRWYGKFELSLTPIGVVTAAPNRIRLIGKGGVKLAAGRRGYEHFG